MIERIHRRPLSLLLLATLMLRASIPDGYMPAPLAAGMPFVLCPSGVPAGFMAQLTGAEHHHHHGSEGRADSSGDPSECPVGHMLTPAFAFDDQRQHTATAPASASAWLPDPAYSSATSITSRSRGPPA